MPSPPLETAPVVPARDHAVVCLLEPLALLEIGGVDATVFLHGQLSSDVTGLDSATCQYSSYNSPKGRMLANFVLWRDGGAFRLLLAADLADPIRKRLSMFVLRSRVTLADRSAEYDRFGIGGPGAAGVVLKVFGAVPEVFAVQRTNDVAVLGLPGPRYVAICAPGTSAAIRARLLHEATAADFSRWQWLTIRAGVPVITAATQDLFVAQAVNWDVLGGVNFQKGCYTGQEIIARTQYLGRLKERLYAFHAETSGIAAGTRLFSTAFAEQPCGTVVNSATAPDGGSDLLAVLQTAAAESGDVRLAAPDGPALAPVPLPYAVPVATAPRGRIA